MLTNTAPIDEIQLEFELFHKKNPAVYTTLVQLARQAKAIGFERYSIQTLIEVVRWHLSLKTKSNDYKLNNDFASRYSRLIMDTCPDLAGFFSIRTLNCEKKAKKLADAKAKFDQKVAEFLNIQPGNILEELSNEA